MWALILGLTVTTANCPSSMLTIGNSLRRGTSRPPPQRSTILSEENICKEDVTSGYVLCRHCAGNLEPYTLPPELSYFIDQLAEEIVLSETIPTCRLCSIGECQSQVGGLVCRNAVKAWLLERAKRYLCPKAEAKTGDKRE